MANPSLYYPVKPQLIVQGFGANFQYYHETFGTNGHMGLDIRAAHGTPVYAAHDGIISFHKDSHGGEGMYLCAPGFQTIYWHLCGDTDPNFPSPLPLNAAMGVKAGDLIGYADNSGAPYESSGDHLHFGLMLLGPNGEILNSDNGFGGCVDPTPFFNGFYAQDASTVLALYSKLLSVLKALVGGSATNNQ